MKKLTQDQYPQLLAYRAEGLAKVGARFIDEIEKPRSRCFYPALWNASQSTEYPSVGIGPLRIGAVGPSMVVADELLRGRTGTKVLDIGCAAGRFRQYLKLKDPNREVDYVGMDVAPPPVDFPVFTNLGDVKSSDFDMVFMSEVAEHMPADVFAEHYLSQFPRLLKPTGIALVGVPNPLAPTILHRDVTHIQHYPWFDLYAMLRFYFDEVDVLRTHFVHTPRRLLSLPLLRLLSYFLEMDWCEGLTLIARRPRCSMD